MKIAMISSWNRNKCGIKEYSNMLTENTNIVRYSLKDVDQIKGYDIVHVQYEHSFLKELGINFLKKLKKKNKKVILTIHEIFPIKRGILRHLRDIILHKTILQGADAYIVHTKEAYEYTKKIHKNIYTIPHGIPCKKCNKIKSREELNLKDNEFIVIIPGFIEPRKHYIEIAKLLKDVSIIAVGSAKKSNKEYETRVKKYMRVTGFLEHNEFIKYFCTSDVVLLFYDYVTQSGPASIAIGMEKPIIASNLPYFQELEEKKLCKTIKDLNELPHAIKEIKEGQYQLNKKEKNNMCWKKVRKQHYEIYNKIIQFIPT